jgi:hypothetical protein
MHFSNSLMLALAASAVAAPTPSKDAGMDQLLSGLLDGTAVCSGDSILDRLKRLTNTMQADAGSSGSSTPLSHILPRDADARGPGNGNGGWNSPDHPRQASKRSDSGPGDFTGNPSNHPREAKEYHPPGSPNPETTDPNHGHRRWAEKGEIELDGEPQNVTVASGPSGATHCC